MQAVTKNKSSAKTGAKESTENAESEVISWTIYFSFIWNVSAKFGSHIWHGYIENMATIHKVKLNILTAYGFTLSSLIAMIFTQIHEFKQWTWILTGKEKSADAK